MELLENTVAAMQNGGQFKDMVDGLVRWVREYMIDKKQGKSKGSLGVLGYVLRAARDIVRSDVRSGGTSTTEKQRH